MTNLSAMTFANEGAQLFEEAVKPCLPELEAALSDFAPEKAGIRIHGTKALAPFLARDGHIGTVVKTVLGSGAMPVRAILFNKLPETNWSLGWHQDRTIRVKERRDTPGFGPWTIKGGINHVAPPFDLLARMVTVRVHLDEVPTTNAPLMIAPNSHSFGRILEGDVDEIVRRCGTIECLAEAGDVWLYATPILHASRAATVPTSRRVLQIDFAVEVLPDGLEWLGI